MAAARPVAREIELVNRVEPTFPRGYDADHGTVRVRLQVDARGTVTSVDIVETSPPRVFDRTVRTALQQWRYEATGEAFSVIAEINFTRGCFTAARRSLPQASTKLRANVLDQARQCLWRNLAVLRIIAMIAAQLHCRAAEQRGAHIGRKFEAQKMHS